MTTVCYHAGHGIMVADRMINDGDRNLGGIDDKIAVLADGSLLGMAGAHGATAPFRRWLEQGADYDARPDITHFEAIVVRPCGRVEMWDEDFVPMAAERPHVAIGSGAGYALGAMGYGAPPEDAVKIAIRHDMSSGEGVMRAFRGDRKPARIA